MEVYHLFYCLTFQILNLDIENIFDVLKTPEYNGFKLVRSGKQQSLYQLKDKDIPTECS